MPSPIRRSARGTQPSTKPPPPTSVSSPSTSSLSSGRQDRNGRLQPPQKSATPHSLSSEETSEPPRRSQRSQPAKDEHTLKGTNDVADAVGDEEEEEVTRCICSHQDYPGPPLSEAFDGTDEQADDAGGLFIQCDGCGVWQHGGCVGIIEESQSPDKYFCEECKPKQHDLHTDSRGQKYSLYLPLNPKAARKNSIGKSDDKAKRDREAAAASRGSTDPVTGRRRGTMRSKEHDDEEEQLRRALEESKREVEGSGTGRRLAKRARDDSEDIKQEIKRQRTASESLASLARGVSHEDESDEEGLGTAGNKSKKARAEAAQTARQAELREKETQREKARLEAAGRRQERAGRRRVDEYEAGEETPKANAGANMSPPRSSQPPSPSASAPPEKVSHKKGAGKKAKKLGNNQYSQNRDASSHALTSSPHPKKRQPTNYQDVSSGDEPMANGDSHPTNTSTSTNKNSPGGHENGNGHAVTAKAAGKIGKGKGKGGNSQGVKPGEEVVERSIPNMERALDGMLAWAQKQQFAVGGSVRAPGDSAGDERPFADLSAIEMAERFARNVEDWKRRFAPNVAAG